MTSPDFTVADVLAWARAKPADERYCYTESGGCAVAQFLKETGRCAKPRVGPSSWSVKGSLQWHAFPNGLEDAVCAGGRDSRWTFGALVKRLEAIVQETPAKPTPWLNPQTYIDADCEQVSA